MAAVDMEEETFTVDFGADLIVDYTFDEADQLTLAYATTIHKSQGSEYPAVVVVLMPQHSIMLRRNLLYTAVTRGRKAGGGRRRHDCGRDGSAHGPRRRAMDAPGAVSGK